MANRRMGGGSFDGGYGRRQGNDGFPNQNNSFGPGARQNNFDQNFSRRDSKGDGFYGDNRGQGNRGNFGRDDFNQQRGGGDAFSRRNDDWGRDQPFGGQGQQGGGNMGMMRGPNQGSGQGGQGQQVVMVVPQGNTGAGGIVLPVQATPNPFAMPRQQPMQVIVGNLPAFNSDFGQQILAAASARPQYGQGMVGGAQMGLMNQQQHQQQPQQQRYDRSVAEGGNRSNASANNRFSRQSNQRPGSGRAATLVRRSDTSSGAVNKVTRTSVSSATLRGNRKRTILRDRHGATDEVEKKRPRTNNAQANKARNGVAKGKAMNIKKNNKKPVEKKEEDKKDEEKKDQESAENAEVKKEDEEKMDQDESKPEEKKASKYDEFSTSLLVCKVCQKVMNDGSSLESHISGRAHASMVKILEERFKKRAELLMFESKISEEELGIERDRQRRAGKSNHGGKNSKNFCKMCDCNYSVNWGTHKGGLPHRILKEYLHPTCRYCTTNFVHRMDWVNHLSSVAHLKKVVELKGEGVDIPEAESPNQDDLFYIHVDIGREEKAINILSVKPADYKIPSKEDLKEMLKEENGELVLPEGEIELPKEYDENIKYGEDAILKTEGACCKVCRSYIANVQEIDDHLKSKTHYGMYVAYLKKVIKYREHLKAEAEKKIKEEAERVEKEKKAAEEAAAKAATEEPKVETEEAAKVEATAEVANETEAVVPEQKPEQKEEVKPEDVEMADETIEKKVEAEVSDAKPAVDVKETVDANSPVKEAPKVESPAKEAPKAASPAKEEPKAPSPAKEAASPAKTPQQGRGGQQNRGRGRGGGGNRGSMGSPRGRGGQTPQRGGTTPRGGGTPRGGPHMRGRTPARGGGGDSNWRGGGRGGQRGGRGNFR